MSEYTRAIIEHEYQKLIEKMKDGTLFGEPIDVNDIKQVVYAAFLIGMETPYRKNHDHNRP